MIFLKLFQFEWDTSTSSWVCNMRQNQDLLGITNSSDHLLHATVVSHEAL